MANDQERAAFEAWATDNGEYPQAVERDSAGNYRLLKVHTDWIAWQAARAALAAAPQVPAVPQWQPIETAPIDKLVLLYGAKRSEMVVGMNSSRDGWVIDTPSEWAGMYTPTHWMPLPASPSAAPQPAECVPLTRAQVDACWDGLMPSGHGKSRYDIARAIEQAHGIRAAGVKEPGNAGHQGREASPA